MLRRKSLRRKSLRRKSLRRKSLRRKSLKKVSRRKSIRKKKIKGGMFQYFFGSKKDKKCTDKKCTDKECTDKECTDKECTDKECTPKECTPKECTPTEFADRKEKFLNFSLTNGMVNPKNVDDIRGFFVDPYVKVWCDHFYGDKILTEELYIEILKKNTKLIIDKAEKEEWILVNRIIKK
jgi:hypothetical protein